MEGPDPRQEPYIDMHEPNPHEVLGDIEDIRDGNSGWYPDDVDDDTPIWRYMDLGKFISLIQKHQLWLSHRSGFEDPYEGRYSKSVAEEIQKERWGVEDPAEEDTEYFADWGEDDYVSCWNMKDSQSAALWEIYVEGANGVAIKSTVGNLKDAINWFPESAFDRLIMWGKVKYHITGDEPKGHHAPIFTKRDIFDFEQEYRVVLTNFESLEELDVEGAKISPGVGIGVEIDPHLLIDEVYISPSAGAYLREVVEDLREEYGPDYSIEKSTVYDHPLVDS